MKRETWTFLFLFTAGGVYSQDTVPAKLRPPGQPVLLFKARAAGAHEFRIVPSHWTGGKTAYWAGGDLRADLMDEEGETIGTLTNDLFTASDKSAFKAVALERVPAPDERALPWQLLRSEGHKGNGKFSQVTFVQRIDTWSGQGTVLGRIFGKVGTTKLVRFQAMYLFFGEAP